MPANAPDAAIRQERPLVVAAEGGERCTCGWPDVSCLHETLGQGGAAKPCEPAITLAEHHQRQKEAKRDAGA